jgi:predicted RNA binding protein YcfA (HicA-like mRNA interferase family)
MPPFGPISRVDLIRALRALGYSGPFSGGRHAFMVHGERRLAIPNQHRGVIGVNLLARILRQAGLSRDEWESV